MPLTRAQRSKKRGKGAGARGEDGKKDETKKPKREEAREGTEETPRVVSSASELWAVSDEQVWEQAEQKYSKAIQAVAASKKQKAKGDRLLELDKWLWHDLLSTVEGRSKPFITKEELEKIMEWKITRGKFRPLMRLVKQNDAKHVETCSARALTAMPDIKKAITVLTDLKGVGPATASAILAPLDPRAPFMSDEAMLAIPQCHPIEYKLPHYLTFADCIKAKAELLGKAWTCERVGRALWAQHYAGSS